MTTATIATVVERFSAISTRGFLVLMLPIWLVAFVGAGAVVGAILAAEQAWREWVTEWWQA